MQIFRKFLSLRKHAIDFITGLILYEHVCESPELSDGNTKFLNTKSNTKRDDKFSHNPNRIRGIINLLFNFSWSWGNYYSEYYCIVRTVNICGTGQPKTRFKIILVENCEV